MAFRWFASCLSGIALAGAIAGNAAATSSVTASDQRLTAIPAPAAPSFYLAQSRQPNLSDAEQEALDDLLIEGQDRVEAQDYDAAISLYREAIRIDPSNARLFSGIGYLYVQQGEYTAAIDPYQQAIALDPDNIDRKSTRLNSSPSQQTRMPSSA